MDAELLIGSMSGRGRCMMSALYEGARKAGVSAQRTDNYSGNPERLLVTYGLGDASRFAAFQKHRAKGGRSVITDMGFWARKAGRPPSCLQRFAINSAHCDALVFAAPPNPDRLAKYGPVLRSLHNPDGPVIVVGQGAKGNLNSGYKSGEFELKALAIARARWPHKKVHYRPKMKRTGWPALKGADITLTQGTITDVLNGASVVMCQHSNVGVDAVVAGVPVLAEAGAVCALHGYGLDREPTVATVEDRQRFLEHLASWQWTPDEVAAGEVWPFLLEMLAA